MSTLLFYKNVVALDREQHKSLRLKSVTHMRFAAEATATPIVLGEFVDVARQCPIAFLRIAEGGGLLPVALVGLPGGRNVYLDAKGNWDTTYVPAFVRRYPFVFAETGPDQLTLCIDRDFEGFNESTGAVLFEAGGEPSVTLQGALGLLSEFQRQHGLTQDFVKRLEATGILSESSASASLVDGRSLTLQGLWVIDEAKLAGIPEATLKEWFASGELAMVYAHLFSMGNLVELLRRQGPAAVAAPASAKKKSRRLTTPGEDN